jgi:hypothetical protein
MKIPKINTNTKNKYPEKIVKVTLSDKPVYERDIDFANEKEFMHYVKDIERIIRKSQEYKKYIKYLKDELDINKCSFLPQVDIKEVKGVGLEMHHYPFTLFDIVSIVIKHHLSFKEEKIYPFLIAEEVMEAHFNNIIGLVPLSKTVHKLAHNGSVYIGLNQIFGNVKEFIKKYKYGVTQDYKEMLIKLLDIGNALGEDYKPEKLDKLIQYLEYDEDYINNTKKIPTQELA